MRARKSSTVLTPERIPTTTSFSDDSAGGGIMLSQDSTTAVITETNISKNSSTSGGRAFGGGLHFAEESATISSCMITGNRANAPTSNGLGGGILADGSKISIKNASTIESNLASFDGGGIKNIASTITVSPIAPPL